MIRSLQPVGLTITELKVCRAKYTDILRMKVSDWGGDILAFLRITAGGDDPMIALSKVRMLACTT